MKSTKRLLIATERATFNAKESSENTLITLEPFMKETGKEVSETDKAK